MYNVVFATACVGCHGMPPADAANGKLGMIANKQAFYDAMVSKPAAGPGCAGKGTLVVPFQSIQSVLFQKLSAVPICGMRMPLMGMLTDAQVTLIERWIDNGAKND